MRASSGCWIPTATRRPTTRRTSSTTRGRCQRAGCDLDFQLRPRGLQAAGILPVFAAGNGGPGAGSSLSPADNPEAFAVGGDATRRRDRSGVQPWAVRLRPGRSIRARGARRERAHDGPVRLLHDRQRHVDRGAARRRRAGAAAERLPRRSTPSGRPTRCRAARSTSAPPGADNDFGVRAPRRVRRRTGGWRPRRTSTSPATPSSATTAAGGSVSYSHRRAGAQRLRRRRRALAHGAVREPGELDVQPGDRAGGDGVGAAHRHHRRVAGTGHVPAHHHRHERHEHALDARRHSSYRSRRTSRWRRRRRPRTTPPGGSVDYTVSTAAVGGFTGDVALSLSGLTAAQASWSFAPAPRSPAARARRS